MPSSPGVGSKTTLEPLLLDFPLPGENDGYCLDGMTPIGVVPVGASRLWGIGKGLLIGPKP